MESTNVSLELITDLYNKDLYCRKLAAVDIHSWNLFNWYKVVFML